MLCACFDLPFGAFWLVQNLVSELRAFWAFFWPRSRRTYSNLCALCFVPLHEGRFLSCYIFFYKLMSCQDLHMRTEPKVCAKRNDGVCAGCFYPPVMDFGIFCPAHSSGVMHFGRFLATYTKPFVIVSPKATWSQITDIGPDFVMHKPPSRNDRRAHTTQIFMLTQISENFAGASVLSNDSSPAHRYSALNHIIWYVIHDFIMEIQQDGARCWIFKFFSLKILDRQKWEFFVFLANTFFFLLRPFSHYNFI